MFIKNFEELEKIQTACTAALSDKFSGAGRKRAIVLCGGTGCLSSNSAEIKNKIIVKGIGIPFISKERRKFAFHPIFSRLLTDQIPL